MGHLIKGEVFRMRPAKLLLAFLWLPAAVIFGQDELSLRDRFEGKYVTVKIDMPATKDGVDLFPVSARPMDLRQYSQRIRTHGAALKKGDSVMVTLVRVKEKIIEFQLAGGGFGTLLDDSGSVSASQSAPKTKHEKELEEQLKDVTDKEKKKSLERELRDLRSERSRDDARLRAEAAQAEEARKMRVRQQALGAGSRFNLRFPDGIPRDALTPEAVMEVLAEYVEFTDADVAGGGRAADSTAAGPPARTPVSTQPNGLRRGLTQDEVAASLGVPESCSEKAEGALKVTTCLYRLTDARVEGQFVEGVLIRYVIASQ